MNRIRIITGLLLCLLMLGAPVGATLKGLNQVVTPDIQPLGVLSVSYQLQNSALGNSNQLQFELGLTSSLEVAVNQGLSPAETVLGVEVSLYKSKALLLSTGVLGLQERATPQPFLVGGYYHRRGFVIAGVQQQNSACVAMLGAGYQYSSKILLTADYLGGAQNFATVGVTLALSRTLSVNPALYFANNPPHRVYPYGVLTLNIKAW